MEIQTLVVVLGLTHGVQVVVLALQAAANPTCRGTRFWLLWSALAALGFPFIVLRSIPALEGISILAQNGFIVLGTVFLYVGILRFLGRRESPRLILSLFVAFLASLAVLTYWIDVIEIRTVIICLALATTSLLSAHALLSHAHDTIRMAARFCAVAFILHGAVVLHRAAMVMAGANIEAMLEPSPLNVALYLDGILVSLLWTFGLVIMVNQSAHAETMDLKDRFELLFNSSPDAVIITRASDGMCREINDGVVTLSGFERSEIIGRTTLDLDVYCDPLDRQRVVDELRERGSCDNVELAFRRKDGRRLTGILSARLFPLDGVPHVVSVIRDVTARTAAEASLRAAEGLLRVFFELSPVGHCIVVPGGRLERVNPALCRMLGYSAEELALTALEDITHPDDLLASQQAVRRLEEGEIEASSTETRYIARDGLTVWAQVDTTLSRDQEGRPLHLLMHILDITERKRAETELRRVLADVEKSRLALLSVVEDQKRTEAALRDSERRLSEAQRMAQLGYWHWDVSTGEVEWSEEVFRIFGLDSREFSPRIDSIMALSPWPEDHERDDELVRKAITSREQGAFEQRFLRPDGSVGFYYSTFQGKYDELGGLVAIVGTVLDITERRRADEALRRQKERLESLRGLDQAILQGTETPEAIARLALCSLWRLLRCDRASVGILDESGTRLFVLAFNGEGGSISKVERAVDDRTLGDAESLRKEGTESIEAVGRSPSSSPGSRILPLEGVVSRISLALHSAQGVYGALAVGWRVPFSLALEGEEIAREMAGQITRAIEQDRQVKERKRYAADLERRVAERTSELEAANEELEAFTYSVSHDLRAPLRAIGGYTQILTEGYEPALDAEGRRLLGVVRSQTLRMGHLLDDLLRFSRIGRHPLFKMPIDMTALVGEIEADLVGRTPERSVEFCLHLLPGAPADPSLIRQVWLNLLDNALKYTRRRERARIEVTGTIRDQEVVYRIDDDGAGFDMRYADRLFGVFQRLHGEGEFEGTGVGLALVQRIVHRHGGRVWAEGEVDRGASFSFSLPLAEDGAGSSTSVTTTGDAIHPASSA